MLVAKVPVLQHSHVGWCMICKSFSHLQLCTECPSKNWSLNLAVLQQLLLERSFPFEIYFTHELCLILLLDFVSVILSCLARPVVLLRLQIGDQLRTYKARPYYLGFSQYLACRTVNFYTRMLNVTMLHKAILLFVFFYSPPPVILCNDPFIAWKYKESLLECLEIMELACLFVHYPT